ncbi:MAG: hypothetical protein JWM85_1663 [Acidimicrobiaceae bacterium]|nr:hypothetical protein [Acidimicrobiaceae bacterium]
MIRRGFVAFGRFWWDFLIGDTPELFVGALVVIGVAFALRHERAAAVVTVPLLIVLVLGLSTYRGRLRRSESTGH